MNTSGNTSGDAAGGLSGRPTLHRNDQRILIDFGTDENMTSPLWAKAMHGFLDEIEADESPGYLVTTGSGKHYSNGLDTTHLGAVSLDDAQAYVRRVTAVAYRLMLLNRPTVAAVNGHAFGMGAFMVIAHDHAVMRDDRGYICFPEVHLRMSFPRFLMAIADAALPPRARRQALATGARYGAGDAIAAGMVDQAASIEDLLDVADGLGAPHAANASESLGVIKAQLFPEIVDLLAES